MLFRACPGDRWKMIIKGGRKKNLSLSCVGVWVCGCGVCGCVGVLARDATLKPNLRMRFEGHRCDRNGIFGGQRLIG